MMASLSLSPHQSIAHRIDAQMGLLHEYYYIHENVILSIAKWTEEEREGLCSDDVI